MNLWTGIRTRGPTEAPCSSTSNARTGTRILPLPPRYNGQRRSRSSSAEEHNPIASASIGARSDGIATESPNLINTRSVKVVWEDTEDDVYVPAPPGGKTLKINVDLMLWRCRQARLKAQLSLDEEERRELLKEAEAGLRRCLVLDPADGRTYVVLGKLYMVQRRFQEARALYAEGVANTGNLNAYIWSAWGWLEFKTGNMPRARQLFDAATLVDSTHACAWHKWGLLEKSEGNYTKARDLWIKGIQRCRTRPQAQNAYLFNALAVMAAELKRVSEARAWFDEGTNSIEGAASVALWQAWAVLEANQGDPEAVRYLFKKAIDANPRSRYVHLAWALWERKLGNLDTCSQLLQRGQAMNATDAALYQARALIEWRDKGNAEAARALFEAGVRADPGHIPLWQAWGCMEAQLGRVDQARELFQQGVWADPRSRDTVWVFHAWGCLERAQDKLQTARELFKAAIKVDPKAEKVWFTWIAMEADAGLLERADELRIRQAEQQWEFEVPAGFTTRPSGGLSATLAAGPLQALKDTLSRFFSVRSAGSGGAAQPVLNQPPARPTDPGVDLNSVRSFLPADFTGDLSLQDMLMMVAKRSAGTAADPSGADAAARLLDASLTRPGGQQVLAQANALMSADLGSEEDEMLEASIKPPRAQLQAYAAAVAPSASTDTRAAFQPPVTLNGTTAQAAEAATASGVDGTVEKRAGKRSRGKRRSATPAPAPVVVPAYLKEFATSPQRQPARQSTSNVTLVARPTRPDRSLDEEGPQTDRIDHAAEAVARQPAAVAEPVSDARPPS